MRVPTRLLLTAAAGAASLAFTGTAGALDFKLSVGTGTPGLPSTNISFSFDRTSPPPARIQLFVPAGYTLKAPTRTGAKLGKADGIIWLTDVNGEDHQQGDVSVANPGDATIIRAQQGCADGAHTQTWVVNVTGAAGGYFNFPIFVDRTTGAEAQLGAYKLTVCLTAPDVPSAHPKRSPNGERLVSLNMRLTAFTNPAATGDVRWRGIATPFNPGAGTLNAAANVERQAVLALPQRISLAVSGRTLRGRLTAAGKPVANALVRLDVGTTRKRLSAYMRVRTRADGTFSAPIRATGTRYFRADVTLGASRLISGLVRSR